MKKTAERLMDLAEAHIRDAGYGSFSFRGLAAEAGIRSASAHHHFPTKAAMTAAVARRYGDRFLAAIAPRDGGSAEDVISVYTSVFRASLVRTGRVCLFGMLGAEVGGLSLEVVHEILSFMRQCIDDLSRRVGGDAAEARAFQIMASLHGGMMLAGVFNDVEAFDQAVAPLVDAISPTCRYPASLDVVCPTCDPTAHRSPSGADPPRYLNREQQTSPCSVAQPGIVL